MALSQLGRSSESVSVVADLVARKPDTHYSELLGKPYWVCAEMEKLRQLAEKLKARAPGEAGSGRVAWLKSSAYIDYYLGRHQEAQELLLRVRLDSDFNDSDRLFLARMLRESGKLNEAIDVLRQSSSPANAWSMKPELAKLYLRKGMTNEAAEIIDSFCSALLARIKSGAADAGQLNQVAWTYIENRVNLKPALDYARRAVALAPQDQAIQDSLAWALFLNGDSEGALARFAPALTNAATPYPDDLLARSAWQALTEMAGLKSCMPLLLGFAKPASEGLQSHPLGLARLNLVLSRVHENAGAPGQALAARAASGYPDERRWLYLGPFPNETNSGFGQAFISETGTAFNTNTDYATCRGPLHWGPKTDGLDDGILDLNKTYGPAPWATAYVFTSVESEREQPAELRLASTDGAKVWLNGTLAFGVPGPRPLKLDQDVVPITLRRGTNSILVKVCNQRELWKFSLRLTAPGGRPLTGMKSF